MYYLAKLSYTAYTIHRGRSCGAEIAELSEEVIRIAKHYMLADTSNFEVSRNLIHSILSRVFFTNNVSSGRT